MVQCRFHSDELEPIYLSEYDPLTGKQDCERYTPFDSPI